uniref:Uncharacterized protein n=1 Tax=Avena sativa TaxID=4498 RepID=A0ACD5XZI2_AVESA
MVGHVASECTAVLCIYCEKVTHEAKDCHLLSMPKPTAVTYGLCRSELMFHEVPASDEVNFKHDSGKEGRITVEGGVLTAHEVINELRWIIPGGHQWVLTPVADNVFHTIFPTKVDLTRMTKIINIPIEKSMNLKFEEWSSMPVDKYRLEETWVLVRDCPKKLRCDYLGLFAVGSLIGKAKEVDMVYTRAHGVARMFVQVTSVEFIPTGTDHTYDGEGFGITFEVERAAGLDDGDAPMQDATDDGDDESKDKRKTDDVAKDTSEQRKECQ